MKVVHAASLHYPFVCNAAFVSLSVAAMRQQRIDRVGVVGVPFEQPCI